MASARNSKEEESYTVLTAHFGTMWHEKIYPDIKLKTKAGGEYPAHKCVLSARSAVFAASLRNCKEEYLDIFNVGCDHYVEDMLRYIYSGFVGGLYSKSALALYTLAAHYELLDLKDITSSYLKEHITPDSAPVLMSLAFVTSDGDLRAFANKFIKKQKPSFLSRLKYVVSPDSFPGPSQVVQSSAHVVYINEEQSLAIKKKLIKDFKSMMDRSICSDIKLKANSGEFSAHKCVLAARSPNFKNLLSDHSSGIFDMGDMDSDTVSRMLRYFYTGQVEELTMDSAVTLYVAAVKYGFGLPLVKRLCLSYLTEHLDPSNAHDTLEVLQLHPNDELQDFIFALMKANIGEYLSNEEIKSQLLFDSLRMISMSQDSGSSSDSD